VARVATLAALAPLGRDQAALLVEAERRRGDAAPFRDLADREQVGHLRTVARFRLDFKFT
jgi:hypothetical protein